MNAASATASALASTDAVHDELKRMNRELAATLAQADEQLRISRAVLGRLEMLEARLDAREGK